MNMSILVDGYYGAHNLGDEAILRVILARLRAQDVSNISVLSFDANSTQLTYDVTAIPRRDIDSPTYLWKLWSAVRSSDLIIIGGGGLLQDLHIPLSIPRYFKTLVLAKLLDKPVVTYAIGVGPVRHSLGKYMLRSLSHNFDYITVRDQESKELLESFGVPDTIDTIPDPVWSFGSEISIPDGRTIFDKEEITNDNILLVSITTSIQQQDVRGLAHLIDAASRELDLRPVFIPLKHGDWKTSIIKDIQNQLTVEFDSIERLYSPAEVLAIMKMSQFIIASKLHAVILAAAAYKPLLVLSYAPKVSSAAKLLSIPSWSVDEIDIEACVAYMRKAIQYQKYEVPTAKGSIAQLLNVKTKRMTWLQKFSMIFHYINGYCWGLGLTAVRKVNRDWFRR